MLDDPKEACQVFIGVKLEDGEKEQTDEFDVFAAGEGQPADPNVLLVAPERLNGNIGFYLHVKRDGFGLNPDYFQHVGTSWVKFDESMLGTTDSYPTKPLTLEDDWEPLAHVTVSFRPIYAGATTGPAEGKGDAVESSGGAAGCYISSGGCVWPLILGLLYWRRRFD